MFPLPVSCILKMFDVWGFDTGLTSISKNRQICACIHFLHIAFAIIFALYKFHLIVELFALIGPLRTINELIQYSIALYSYWLVIFDSIVYRRRHHDFWKIHREFDKYFCSQTMDLQRYLLKFIEFFPINIFLYTMIYATNSFPDSNSVFVFLFLITICQLRIFYYLFCVEVVKCHLRRFENEVLGLKNRLNFGNNMQNIPLRIREQSSLFPFELTRFKWIRNYFHSTHAMMEVLNDTFGWSQVAAVIFCFYSFATDLNWLYSCLDEFSFRQNVIALIWIVHARLMIYYLFRVAHCCYVTVCFKNPLV